MSKKNQSYWISCKECHGTGKKRQRLRKKIRLNYQKELEEFEKTKDIGLAPTRPKGHLTS